MCCVRLLDDTVGARFERFDLAAYERFLAVKPRARQRFREPGPGSSRSVVVIEHLGFPVLVLAGHRPTPVSRSDRGWWRRVGPAGAVLGPERARQLEETVKLWKDNRIDGEWELSEQEVADRFLASRWAQESWAQGWPLDRALRAFLTAGPEDEGLASVWDEGEGGTTDYDRVFDLVLAQPAAERLFPTREAGQ